MIGRFRYLTIRSFLFSMESISDHVVMARVAEQSERYEDMKEFIKYVATTIPDGQNEIHFSAEERNLLSVAYKNVISTRRSAWRNINAIEQKESSNPAHASVMNDIKEFRKKIEDEMKDICTEVIGIIEKYLLHEDDSVDNRVYFYKMIGDYYRYECEFLTGSERDDAIANSDKK